MGNEKRDLFIPSILTQRKKKNATVPHPVYSFSSLYANVHF